MATEIWVATPPKGSLSVVYTPPTDTYPKTVTGVNLIMPPGYDPNAPNHQVSLEGPFPTLIPLLQGFNVGYGTNKVPTQHWVRELHVQVDLDDDDWHTGPDGQWPIAKVTIGLRDNSGPQKSPDDPFVARVFFSILVIYS
jgi:hypothetical protein